MTELDEMCCAGDFTPVADQCSENLFADFFDDACRRVKNNVVPAQGPFADLLNSLENTGKAVVTDLQGTVRPADTIFGNLFKTAENVGKKVLTSDFLVDKATDLVVDKLKKLGVDTDTLKPVIDILKAALKEIKNIKSINVTDDNGKPRIEIERTSNSDFGIGPAKFRISEKVAFTVAPAGAGIALTKIEGIGTPIGKRSIGLQEAKIVYNDGKVDITAKPNLAFVPPVKVTVDPVSLLKRAIAMTH